MSIAVLDLNADRVWAMGSPDGGPASLIRLDGRRAELPLAISLAKRSLEIGAPALALERQSPHLVCHAFMPQLGTNRVWRHHRHQLDAGRALALVFQRLHKVLKEFTGLILIVPDYLAHEQIVLAGKLAKEAGFKIIGVATRLVAAGLSSYTSGPWYNMGLFIDVDGHALSLTAMRPADDELRLLARRTLPEAGLRIWKERLLKLVAEECIRTSRRDPRDSAEAEQGLIEDMDRLLDHCSQNQSISLHVQSPQWLQTLTIQPAAAVSACRSLARLAAGEMGRMMALADEHMTSATVYLTAGAARLPGLAAAIYHGCDNKTPVVFLEAQGPARAAHELGERIMRRRVPPGIFDVSAPLPPLERPQTSPVLPFPRKTAQAAGK